LAATALRDNVTPRHQYFGLRYSSIMAVVCVLDLALIVLASIAAAIVYAQLSLDGDADIVRYAAMAGLVSAVFVPMIRSRGLYDPRVLVDWKLQARNVTVLWLMTFLVLAGIAFSLKIGGDFSRGTVMSFAAVGLVALLAHRGAWRSIIKSGLRSGSVRGHKAILLCMHPFPEGAAIAQGIIKDLQSHGFAIDHVFYVGGSGGSLTELTQRAIAFARGSEIEEIFFAADLQRWGEIRHLVQKFCELPLPLTLLPDPNIGELFQRTSRRFGKSIGVEFQRAPLTIWERALKRSLDIVVALGGIVMLAPMMVIIALAIKLDSPGPALFRQTRRGFNSREFKIFKFRTMSVLEDGATVTQAVRNDTRVTRMGSWLRKTSLDELPQLFNVLSGEMSIVGPRPHATAHDDQFSELISHYAFRHHMKPGITGWAQANGYRGETPTLDAIKKRVELDIWYVDNWSVALDIRIIFQTVIELLRGRNAY
jgi:Undecaprenyl-phosphate glucose phosphotransferase